MLQGSELELASHILGLVQSLLLIWLSLTPGDILVKAVTTAMTNYVFHVTVSLQGSLLEEDSPSPFLVDQPENLLLRVYGNAGEWMFDRQNELKSAQILAEAHLIPPWHGIFGNGRIEHFILSQQTTAAEFRSLPFAKNIVSNLARIHIKLPEIISITSWDNGIDYLWGRLESWRQRAQTALDGLPSRNLSNRQQLILEDIRTWNPLDLESQQSLQETAIATDSPIVFGHCDVQLN